MVLYEIDTDKLIGKYINNIKSDPGCFLAVQGNPDFGIIAVNVKREISKEEGNRLPNDDEIPIYSARQLASIGVDEDYPLDGTYIQMEMIDLSREGNWIPIANVDGENPEYFSGTFNGNGFTIRNLTIKRNEEYQGLFKRISGELVDISLVNVDVNGNQYIGALVGDNHGTIKNCTSNGKVHGNSNIGGLVGINRCVLSGSESECNVSGLNSIGGLVGGNQDQGSIKNCNFIGKAIGEENSYSVGGIVGYNSNTVDNSHSSGDIFSGGSNTGGIAGANGGIITESTSNGKITGDINHTGGIVGYNDGEIKNSNFDGNILGDDRVGGIAGCNNNGGKVEDCHLDNSGVVSGRVSVGGVVGSNINASVIDTCYSAGVVSGKEGSTGGLVGYNENSIVQKCYFTGSVNTSVSSWGVGGLVGRNTGMTGGISNSYSTGSVSGSGGANMGGLVGYNDGNITNTYSIGTVDGIGDAVGGLVGFGDDSNIVNSYWDKETSGKATSLGGGIGKNISEMKSKDTFIDWDFETIWNIDDGVSYPYLR